MIDLVEQNIMFTLNGEMLISDSGSEMAFKDINNLKERRAVLDKYPLVKANYQRTSALPTSLSWKAKKPAFHGF